MKQTQADNLKPGNILLNIGIINTVKLTKNHVEITIIGSSPTNSERYFEPDELVYLHEELEIPESELPDETLLP